MDNSKMDKRKKRTSYQQYVIYLKMLEEDQIFRTGIIPRDVELNYLTKKWEDLAEKLNCCGHGPVMSSDEWKKRLNDWKNSTRAKFRKCQAEQYKQNETKTEYALTPLEERALLLWGPLSSKSLSSVNNEQSTTYILPEQSDIKPTDIISIKADSASQIIIEPVQIQAQAIAIPPLTPTQEVQAVQTPISVAPPSPIQQTPPAPEPADPDEDENPTKRKRHDSVDEQTFGLLKTKSSISSTDIKTIANELRRIADIKEEKLRFEIAKFEFRNPGFKYSYTPITSNDSVNDSSATCTENSTINEKMIFSD